MYVLVYECRVLNTALAVTLGSGAMGAGGWKVELTSGLQSWTHLWFWKYILLYVADHFDIDILSLLLLLSLSPSDSKPESLEAHKIKTAFFTHPTLTEIGRRLVSHYFLLTEEELAMWEEDPESFGNITAPDIWAESKCLEMQIGRLKRNVLKKSRIVRIAKVKSAVWLCVQTWIELK